MKLNINEKDEKLFTLDTVLYREIFTNVEDLKLASNLMYSVARAARISQCRPGNLDESS